MLFYGVIVDDGDQDGNVEGVGNSAGRDDLFIPMSAMAHPTTTMMAAMVVICLITMFVASILDMLARISVAMVLVMSTMMLARVRYHCLHRCHHNGCEKARTRLRERPVEINALAPLYRSVL